MFKRSNLKGYVHLFCLIIIIFIVIFLGVGYSAFGSELTVSGVAATVRVDRDIRVKAFKINDLSENVISSYEEYNYNNVSTKLKLPNKDSYGIFEVEIYNYGNVEYGILGVDNSNSNLKYEIMDYNVGELLCDDIDYDKCSLGSKTTIKIKISYADDGVVSDKEEDITLTFDFREGYHISYYGIDDTDLPKVIIEGLDYSYKFNVDVNRMKVMMDGVALALGTDSDYTYIDGVLTIKNVTGDLKILDYQPLIVTPTASSFKLSASGGAFNYIYNIENLNSYDVTYEIISTCDKFTINKSSKNVAANSTVRRTQVVNSTSTGVGTLRFNILSPYEDYIDGEVIATGEGAEYMMIGNNTSEDSTYLGGPILKKDIESISFVGNNEVPDTALGYFDVSYETDSRQTMAWYFDNDNNGLYELFIGYSSTEEDKESVVKPKNSSYLFANLINLKEINFMDSDGINRFDTTSSTSMSYMFQNVSSLTNLDLSNFDTSNVTNMLSMFSYMKSLTSLDLNNFDTSNVTNMSYMFDSSSSIVSLNLSNFDTSKVTNMSGMFRKMETLINLNLINFDTSNVTNMDYMFGEMSSLENLDLSNFDTSNVTDMNSMFNGTSSLINLDLSNFDTTKVTSMRNMFSGMTSVTSINMRNSFTPVLTDVYAMFSGCSSLKTIDISNFDTSNVTTMFRMFFGNNALENIDVSNFDTSNVTTMQGMFGLCVKLVNLDLSNFDTSNVINMEGMFQGDSSLITLNISNFNTSNVTSMYGMFKDVSLIERLDLSNFDTLNVINMTEMFRGARNLNDLNLSNFDFSNVTSFSNMFGSVSKNIPITVKDQAAKNWFSINFPSYTNVLILS